MTNIVYNKNGIPFNIDAIATDLNGKMDRDGVNATCPVVISRTPNNQGGIVEIWSDGYCVQTGYVTKSSSSAVTVTLSQSYINTDYIVLITNKFDNNYIGSVPSYGNTTVNSFKIYENNSNSVQCKWRVEGYIN